MLDDDNPSTEALFEAASAASPAEEEPAQPAKKTAAKRTAKKSTRKAAAKKTATQDPRADGAPAPADASADTDPVAARADADPVAAAEAEGSATAAKKTTKKAAAKKATAKKAATKKATTKTAAKKAAAKQTAEEAAPSAEPPAGDPEREAAAAAASGIAVPLFQPPTSTPAPARSRRRKSEPQDGQGTETSSRVDSGESTDQATEADQDDKHADEAGEQGGGRRRRRRGGRRRRKSGGEGGQEDSAGAESADANHEDAPGDREGKAETEEQAEGGSRRRRRRRRAGDDTEPSGDEPPNTVTKVRTGRSAEDEITGLTGSTRLEAKRQRRREGREAGRRRAPIVSEAEFLARRESVDRVMVIRQKEDLTQIAVLEDKVLVEHYVARESQTSLIGNVYLGRVQNVLPSMEAAFIDIGKGRNAVLYAGEVNWDALGSRDGNRKIEQVLKSGQTVLVQVTKDPIGHKGARLTSQIALPGRFLVYVPDGTTSGISRKLPDTERNRLKTLLKQIVPDSAGVIVRTAAEGASEQELTRDVERLTARWSDISAKAEKGNAPQLLYGEPDLTLKVVRDLFTEDFAKLVVSGTDAWDMVDGYVEHVAPDLADRLEKYDGDKDVFAEYRIDEQIAKGLDRKVWLPSGGSLIIDRTEAMTVVDVNTGKFTGSGGNLEETVTKNNLEAAEEIVRQLRLRDIGGIIVVDFIDMVLESNRDLVLRRLVECLGRDRTRHQVAEVTSLGLVQMTRKRIGTGLLEAFSETCEHCQGRGLLIHQDPVEPKKKADEESRRGRRSGRSRGKDSGNDDNGTSAGPVPSPKDIAAMARHESPREQAEESSSDVDADADTDTGTDTAATAETTAPTDPSPAAEVATSAQQAEPGRAAKRKRSRSKAPDSQEPEPQPVETASPASPAEPAVSDAAPGEPAVSDAAPGEPAVSDAAPGEPAAPKVVTSVRRRSSRPAGPPKHAPAGEPSEEGAVNGAKPPPVGDRTDPPADSEAGASEVSEPSEQTPDGNGSSSVGHVPVKTKTGRRR